MIDQRFLDDLAQDLKLPEDTPTPEMQLASANTGVTTDGGAFVGYRMNMPKGLNTRENMAKQSVLIADTMAGAGKGMIQAFPGLPGDLESIGRMALGYLGYNVDENTVLPTSEEIGKRLESVLGPVIPPNQTTGVPTAERVRAAEGGTTGGEILAPGGQIALASKVAKPVIGATKKIIEAGKDLPVGMSIKGVDESLDPLGFYSAASKAVDNIAQEKGTGQQFLAQIEKTPGVKKEELLWTGLDEFLAGKKSVTKAEVQDYLKTNRVEVKEVQLGGKQEFDANRLTQLESEYNNLKNHPIDDPSFGEEKYNEMIRLMNIKDQSTTETLYRLYDEAISDAQMAQQMGRKSLAEQFFKKAELLNTRAEKLDLEGLGQDAPPRFGKFTLPGGENYREIYMSLPTSMSKYNEFTDTLRAKYGEGGFVNLPLTDVERKTLDRLSIEPNNYEVPRAHKVDDRGADINRVAQLRVNDRVDADGKKVLFVEEIQSDWHQTGRKKGYQGTADKDYTNYINDLTNRYQDEIYTFSVNEGMAEDKAKVLAKKLTNQKAQDPRQLADYFGESEKQMAMNKARIDERNLVPDAPFKGSWHELAMKRAIQLASEGGYDRIAFTTGKTQAERYDLSKQISKISYEKGDNGMYDLIANDMDGTEVLFKEDIPLSEVEDIIGKDMAKKIANDEGRPGDGTGYRNWKTFRGVDLQVGGEGMKGFYDTILPKYLDKYGKKWDAKTGMTEIPTDGTSASVHYMDITPKMKESVLTKGQPLFQMAPAIPAGAAGTQMQEENK